ncbi:MAG: PorT family protein [Candidatus Fibromonas sp.]|jgi:hypothetical protein|nr:PorT family protein [Candidatus Fibromonas sp.]
MSIIAKVITVVVLMAVFSFSQEQESKMRFGGRAAYLFLDDMDGFAVGAVASIRFTRFLNFNSELNFVRRTLHIPFMISCGNYPGSCFFIMKNDLSEFALSVPAQIQFAIPLGSVIAFWVESGIKLDIPLTKGTFQLEDSNLKEDTDDRAAFDFGLPLGVGLLIYKHFALGFRFTVGLTSIGEEVKRSLNQGEGSLMYLF